MQTSIFISLKVGLSPSKKILYYFLDWKPFKIDKNAFYSIHGLRKTDALEVNCYVILFLTASGKLPPGKFPPSKLPPWKIPTQKIPTWNIATHVFKHSHSSFQIFCSFITVTVIIDIT